MDEGEDWQPLLDKLTGLKARWPNQVWTWDDRFKMIASSFDKAQEAAARTSAAQLLTYTWDVKSIAIAPDGLRRICDATGGLRAGQFLMAGKAGGLVLYGLWWPWGNGTKFTLRIGLGDCEPTEPPFPAVRALFGVTL